MGGAQIRAPITEKRLCFHQLLLYPFPIILDKGRAAFIVNYNLDGFTLLHMYTLYHVGEISTTLRYRTNRSINVSFRITRVVQSSQYNNLIKTVLAYV